MATLRKFLKRNLETKKDINKIKNYLMSKEVKDILLVAHESSENDVDVRKRNGFREIKLTSFIQDGNKGYEIYVSSLGFEVFSGIFYLNENIHLHTLRIAVDVYSYSKLLKDLKKVIGFEGEKDGK
jgi:hypothetical protein